MEPSASFLLFLLLLLTPTLYFLRHLLLPANPKTKIQHSSLPPSASPFPVLTHIILHRRSIFDLLHILRSFHSLHGPIFSLRLSPFSSPSIFISDPFLAHSALIHHGAAFADRPPTLMEPRRFLTLNNQDISSSPYGSFWRLLRRNLSSEILHPSRIQVFSPGRHWALKRLFDSLRSESGRVGFFEASIQHAIFSLFVLLCFGEKLSESEIRGIESPLLFLLRTYTSFNVFAVLPAVTKVLFRKRWEKIVGSRLRQAEIFAPMIRARRQRNGGDFEYCYVDSLLDLRLPEEDGRGFTDDEIVVLCHEFLSASIDTTTTALEWTMAELVKNQDVQCKLWNEIKLVIESDEKKDIIKEEDLQTMPYLKAVVMESLRRHPPGQMLMPHSVTEDVTVGGFLIPKGTKVNFAVADVNWDRRNWVDPFEFRPERFMEGGEGEGVDITGSKGMKMIPFGAGRRMCPGYGLAMLHLQFFVANLVREFEWKVEPGEEVDLSEKLEFTTVMKNPLRAQLFPRWKGSQM